MRLFHVKILPLYLFVMFSAQAMGQDQNADSIKTSVTCIECDYIIQPRQYKVDNNQLKLPPGSVLGIRGQNRRGVYLINFHGTKEKPYTVINCSGPVSITESTVGIKIHHSSHIRVTGTGSENTYGIKIETKLHGVQAEYGATDFEIDHVEISGTRSSGLAARTNPDSALNRSNFTQYNTHIHHNYIHDTGNEGIYIGGSHWHTNHQGYKEPELKGVRVHHNKVVNAGYDGIQVGSAVEDCEIYNNTVINYGLNQSTYHQAGLQINPGTTGKIYNNYIEGGTGHAIFLSGFGNDVFNNIIVDCNKYGMYIADRAPLPDQRYRIVNNTLINVKNSAVKMTSRLSKHNIFYNNVLVNVGGIVDKDYSMDMDIANNYISNSLANDLFKDANNQDFTPLKNSPLVDTGKDILNGMGIENDYFLNKRLRGKGVDIGAFELQDEN